MDDRRPALFRHGSPFAPVARDEIVGIDGVLAEVDELVACLRHAEAFARYGARLEPGVLFEGPPGTGKTLVARYLASASDALFVNVDDFMPAGELGAGDLAELFTHARRALEARRRPVVLFWDEFSVGKEPAGPMRTRRSALASRLAIELDGVQGKNVGLLLVACTNNAAEIDDALLRPGRIGLRLRFSAPDRGGKALLLEHYLSGHPTRGDFDFGALSYLFQPGRPAAEIEEAVGEAWRLTVRRSLARGKEPALRESDLRDALLDRLLGQVPLHTETDDDARLRTAVHEVGHALVALEYDVPLTLVTVRPGVTAAGRVLTAQNVQDVAQAKAQLRLSLGGTAAERLVGLQTGIGNSSDTAHATQIALALVDLNGIGPRAGVFNPRVCGGMRPVSEEILGRLDEDALDLLNDARADVDEILGRVGCPSLVRLAELLIERETMLGHEFADAAAEATR